MCKNCILIFVIVKILYAVLAQQAEHFLGKEEVGSSNLLDSSTSEQVTLVPIFYCIKNQSPASQFLLFRKKARSRRLFACKRAYYAFGSLPPFCECAFGAEYLYLPSFSHWNKLRLFRFFITEEIAREKCAISLFQKSEPFCPQDWGLGG